MYVQDNGKTRKLIADEGMKLTNSDRDFFTDFLYMCKNDKPENYEEVPRTVWKHYVEEENPDIMELKSRIDDLQEETMALKEENMMLGDMLLDTDYRLLQIEIFGLETEF